MKKRNLIITIALLGLFLFSLPPMALAAGLIPCGGSGQDPCNFCYLIIGVRGLVDFGLNLLIIAALVGIAIGGMMYILAAGNETALTIAKNFLKASIGGFAIVLAAWLIIFIVMQFISAKDDLGIGKKGWNTFDCVKTPPIP